MFSLLTSLLTPVISIWLDAYTLTSYQSVMTAAHVCCGFVVTVHNDMQM